MSEMIERGVKAIEDRLKRGPTLPPWHALVRVVIEAMREPTKDIINAAGREVWGPDWSNGDPTDVQEFKAIWQAMIDAALTDSRQPETKRTDT